MLRLKKLIVLFLIIMVLFSISAISFLIENKGLGKGDYIDMRFNHLDISEGSEDLKNIKTLEARGIEIDYIPQKK